jgi:23S rRNA (cytosine1962-C5)-methyltransferase
VLDLFAYTGGFAVAAAHGGAQSIAVVESSVEAIETAERHLEPWAATIPLRFSRDDAFGFARRVAGPWDLIVVDHPPPLARKRADVQRAARAYKDILLHALRCAAPEALVLSFRCSHPVDADLFRKITFGASLDAERPAGVARTGAPADHLVALDHPEGR